jgi:hypothetical protein
MSFKGPRYISISAMRSSPKYILFWRFTDYKFVFISDLNIHIIKIQVE